MRMIRKLQRKTLIPAQIAGYIATLLVGTAIVLVALQAYKDLRPLLTQQTDVFKAHTVTVSKNVTMFKSANKGSIYFDDKELASLSEQPFVKEVAHFTSAQFNTEAAISFAGQTMRTDFFFESVPDEYLDVESDEWQWDSTSDFLPLVIPEDYLNLYNFGFAESQSLPVVSEGMLSQVTFTVIVRGNGKRRVYDSRIVGLSGKINSILVPDDFLQWANNEFGDSGEKRSSRLLVEFTDASDERIPAYFEGRGLNISQSELESSKIAFFFRLGMLFVIVIALIIIILSVAFIVMSLNLIVQRNRDLFINLYKIGYNCHQIARYYRIVISIITIVDIVVAAIVAIWIRGLYLEKLNSLFDISKGGAIIWLSAVISIALLLILYNTLIMRTIKKTVQK